MNNKGIAPLLMVAVIALLIIAGISVVVFSPQLKQLGIPSPFEALSGTTIDSDLLTLSQAPTLISGQGNVLCPQGDTTNIPCKVVQGAYVLGAGNDIAVIGSFDKETQTVGGLPADYSTASYTFTAKKEKMDTRLPIVTTSPTYIYDPFSPISEVNQSLGICLLSCPDDVKNAQNNLAKSYYDACRGKSNYLGYGWKRGTVSGAYKTTPKDFSVGGFFPDWRAVITTVCITQTSTSEKVYQYDGTNKNIEMDISVNLTSKNGDTTIGHLTNNQTSVILKNVTGKSVAQVSFAGILGTLILPIDIGTHAPFSFAGTWYDLPDVSKVSTFTGTIQSIQNTIPQGTSSTASILANYDGSYNTQITNVNNAIGARATIIGTKKTAYGQYPFIVSGNIMTILGTKIASNPIITFTALGDWIGIIRNFPEFNLTCPTNMNGEAQKQLSGIATVKNTSTVFGNYTLSYACVGGSSTIMADSLAPNAERQHTITQQTTSAVTSPCTVFISYSGKQKSCNFTISTTPVPIKNEVCGNGIDDDMDGLIDEGCQVPNPEKCGDGLLQTGEDCDGTALQNKTCQTFGFDSGTLSCSLCRFDVRNCIKQPTIITPPIAPPFDWISLILGIILIIAGIAILFIMKNASFASLAIIAGIALLANALLGIIGLIAVAIVGGIIWFFFLRGM